MNLEIVPSEVEEEKPEAPNFDAPKEGTGAVDVPKITIPVGMIEGLKAIRHEIAQLHSLVVKEYNQVPSFLTGAYTAIEDAEGFLKTVANGKEEFTPVPKKPEVKEEDKVTTDGTIKVPSNLHDIPYMQEWAGQFFFPKLRELTVRKDVEVSLRADKNKKKITLGVDVTMADKPTVHLPNKIKANDVIDLAAVAKSIDAL